MSTIQQGLIITLIGMGLVFAVIIFLWGVMALLVKVTTNEKTQPDVSAAESSEGLQAIFAMKTAESQRRSAAAAVAVQILLSASAAGQSFPTSQDTPSNLSPWQSVHRMRQLNRTNR